MTDAPPAYDMLFSTIDSWNTTPTAVMRQIDVLDDIDIRSGSDAFTRSLRTALYARLHMVTAVYYR